jgi:hypothetical protein
VVGKLSNAYVAKSLTFAIKAPLTMLRHRSVAS